MAFYEQKSPNTQQKKFLIVYESQLLLYLLFTDKWALKRFYHSLFDISFMYVIFSRTYHLNDLLYSESQSDVDSLS